MKFLKVALAFVLPSLLTGVSLAGAATNCESLFTAAATRLTIDDAVEKIFFVLPEFGIRSVGIGIDGKNQEVLVVEVDSTIDIQAQPKTFEGFNVRYEFRGDEPMVAGPAVVPVTADWSKFTSKLMMNPALIGSTTKLAVFIRLQDGLSEKAVDEAVTKLRALGIKVNAIIPPILTARAVWSQLESASLIPEVKVIDGSVQLRPATSP